MSLKRKYSNEPTGDDNGEVGNQQESSDAVSPSSPIVFLLFEEFPLRDPLENETPSHPPVNLISHPVLYLGCGLI